MKLQNIINHISLIVDDSGSMGPHRTTLVQVFDKEIEFLKEESVRLDQETRLTIYLFGERIECLVYDMDVMRMKSIKDFYKADQHRTRLYESIVKGIKDLELTPQIYGDHAFLLYVLTDGQNNVYDHSANDVVKTIPKADNWTLVAKVPDDYAKRVLVQDCGFYDDCVGVWDVHQANALQGIGREFRSSMSTYMRNRAAGIRSTKTFYADLDIKPSELKKVLAPVAANSVKVLPVLKDAKISDFYEKKLKKPYATGACFYELTKAESVQNYKEIVIENTKTKKLYTGPEARDLLGLSKTATIRLRPGNHPGYAIFIQSTSHNRKLIGGTRVVARV